MCTANVFCSILQLLAVKIFSSGNCNLFSSVHSKSAELPWQFLIHSEWMKFPGGCTFSSCPTLPRFSLKVSHMSLDKLSFRSHCHNGEVSRPGCPSPALSKDTHDEVMKPKLDSQIRIIPMLHSHSILNKASYFCQHMFTSVFQSREDNGNSLSYDEWKISWAYLWPAGTTSETQIKVHLPLQEVDEQQRDVTFKPN
jgi:hypothetical protein